MCKICKDKEFTATATLMYHYRSHAGNIYYAYFHLIGENKSLNVVSITSFSHLQDSLPFFSFFHYHLLESRESVC